MKFVARGVAIEFGQPPFAAVRRRRAVLAAFVPMPEASMDEDGDALFHQHEVFGWELRVESLRLLTPALSSFEEERGDCIPRSAFRVPRFHGDSPVEAKTIAQTVQERPDGFLRRRVLAADAAHVPRTALAKETIFRNYGRAVPLRSPFVSITAAQQRRPTIASALIGHAGSLPQRRRGAERKKRERGRRGKN